MVDQRGQRAEVVLVAAQRGDDRVATRRLRHQPIHDERGPSGEHGLVRADERTDEQLDDLVAAVANDDAIAVDVELARDLVLERVTAAVGIEVGFAGRGLRRFDRLG